MRSTPIPWLAIRRTVNVREIPRPFMAMIVPSKGWGPHVVALDNPDCDPDHIAGAHFGQVLF